MSAGAWRVVGYIVAAAAVSWLLWWLVGAPRVALGAERSAHADTARELARLKQQIADGDAAAQAVADGVRVHVDEARAEERDRLAKEIEDAYDRGHSAGVAISAGVVRVRDVWRDSECQGEVAGPRAELAGGDRPVPAGRAAAIGDVLGAAGEFDARYRTLYRRLLTAQHILNQVFEQPALAAVARDTEDTFDEADSSRGLPAAAAGLHAVEGNQIQRTSHAVPDAGVGDYFRPSTGFEVGRDWSHGHAQDQAAGWFDPRGTHLSAQH